jgi:hypothetical protein
MGDTTVYGEDQRTGIARIDFNGWATWLVLVEYLVFAATPYFVAPSDLTAWMSVGAFFACVLLTFIPYIRWLPFLLGSLLVSFYAYQTFCKFIRIGTVHEANESGLLYSTHPVAYAIGLAVLGFAVWLHWLVVQSLKVFFAEMREEMRVENIARAARG